MSTRVSIDGRITRPEAATISVLDRGFLYGDSIFEVMRSYRGHLFAVDDHLTRLARSAELLAIALPVAREQLQREIHATVSAAGNAESYVRVIVTRGTGPIALDPALAVDPKRVIIVTELTALAERYYREGVEIVLVPAGRSAGGALPIGAKSGNYLTNLMALRHARARDAHEALMVDTEGRIAEGSTSNIFAVVGGRILTPALELGILEGITRRKVIELARHLGLAVDETELEPADLHAADELFLTSTLREVLPVVAVDERPVADRRPGPITRQLLAAYRQLAVS